MIVLHVVHITLGTQEVLIFHTHTATLPQVGVVTLLRGIVARHPLHHQNPLRVRRLFSLTPPDVVRTFLILKEPHHLTMNTHRALMEVSPGVRMNILADVNPLHVHQPQTHVVRQIVELFLEEYVQHQHLQILRDMGQAARFHQQQTHVVRQTPIMELSSVTVHVL